MQISSKRISLRFIIFSLISLIFTSFILALFCIYHETMPKILLESENKYLTRQVEITQGLLKTAGKSLYLLAEDTAIWDETAAFVEGDNEDFFSKNWSDTSLLASYQIDFVLISNISGVILHADFVHPRMQKPLPLSSDLQSKLDKLSRHILSSYVPCMQSGREGILTADGNAYLLAAVPITRDMNATQPSGILIFGKWLDNHYFQTLTHVRDIHFKFESESDMTEQSPIERLGDDAIRTTLLLYDLEEKPLHLVMTEKRQLYRGGWQRLGMANIILIGTLLLFGVSLYYIIIRAMVQPIEALSLKFRKLAAGSQDSASYIHVDSCGRSQEMHDLCVSINTVFARLSQSQTSLRVIQRIVNAMDAFIYAVDPKTCEILFANKKLVELLNLHNGGIGQICWQVLQQGYSERCPFCPYQQLVQSSGKSIVWEHINTITGRHYKNTDCLISWLDGSLVHLQCSMDISDIKKAEHDLIRMSSIVDSSPLYISYVDMQGNFEYVNAGAFDVLGYSPEELRKGGLSLIFAQETVDHIKTALLPRVSAQGQFLCELPAVRKDGEKRILSFNLFTVHSHHSTGIAAIALDITEHRRTEEDLLTAKELAEQSSRAKSEFLSRMSHEMRTPLTAIMGMTDIACRADALEKKQYGLKKIEEASQHLLGVINDILDMSKIEANKLELYPTKFVVEKMLQHVLDMVSFRIEEKKQIFKVDIASGLPPVVMADEQRLMQILLNLLSNAVKFTPEGGRIDLSVRQTCEQPDSTTLAVKVSDTGIGISPEQQKTLFMPFEQADGGIARKFGGTGLGLAISRRIAELMGGSIALQSEAGRGSSFTLVVPVQKVSLDQENNLQPPTLPSLPEKGIFAGKRILLAEDVEINREIVITLLEETGLQVDCAENGLEACRLFAAAPQAYSLIFMDLHMPEVDGFEATRRIRSMEAASQASHIPIIAMTANVFQEDIECCRAAGMDGHLGKPIIYDKLFAVLRHYCSES